MAGSPIWVAKSGASRNAWAGWANRPSEGTTGSACAAPAALNQSSSPINKNKPDLKDGMEDIFT